MTNFKRFLTLFFISILTAFTMHVWGTDYTYTFTINTSNFNSTSYAANNNEKTSTATCTTDGTKTMSVKWTSNQIMLQSGVMQWQKNNGYIYNSTDLGTINSVTVTSTDGSFTTYYGTSEHPTSGTTVGNGFFTVKVGSATGKTSQIVVNFTVSESGGGGGGGGSSCNAIDVTGGSAVILPAGSTSYSRNDWKTAGAPTAYPTSKTEYTIGDDEYCVSLYQAADFNGDDGLQFKKSVDATLTIEDITSTNGIDIDIVVGGSTTMTASLTGAAADVSGTGTISISTASTTATLVITNEQSSAGYIKTITITPKSSSCSKKVTLTKGAETNGSFSLNKTNNSYDNCDANFVVTVSGITPNCGYALSSVTATGEHSTVTGPDGSGNYTVTYDKGNNITSTINVSFTSAPSVSATPTSLDFGSVLQGASVAAQTFSLSGCNLTSGTLTIAAPSGYSVSPTSISVSGNLAATTITVTPNTATTGTFNGNVTISGGGLGSSYTVPLTMTVAAAKTVTWKVDGKTYTTGSPTTLVASGSKVTTLPTAPADNAIGDCANKFMGWSTVTYSGSGKGQAYFTDFFTDAASSPTISANTTFHAVYATQSGSLTFNSYEKVTSAPDDWTAHKYVLVCPSQNKILTGKASGGNWGDYATFTTSPTTEYASYELTIATTATANYYSIKLGDKYLSLTSNGNNLYFVDSYTANDGSYNKCDWQLYNSSGEFIIESPIKYTISSTSTWRAIRYNKTSGSERFACYKYDSQEKCVLYKRVETGDYTYTNYRTSCGPALAAEDAYVTSTKDQKVKIVVPVTAKNFTTAQTISYSGVTTSSSPFKFIGWTNGNSITAGSTLETGAIIEYKPTAYNTTNNVTITFSATGADNETATVHGRSLPQQFAIVATKTNNFAMPASTANTAVTRTGLQVMTSGTPETVVALPATYVYTLEEVASSRYATNGFAVRLKGDDTEGYLKAVAANEASIANLTGAADEDMYEWILSSEDNETYHIANNNSAVAAVRSLRYYDKFFGMYGSGIQDIRLLPIGCATMPENVTMTPTHNSATLTFSGSAVTHTLVIKQGSTTIYNSAVSFNQEITGLTPSTTYTYTLTPGSDDDCAIEGEFTTSAAPITITLHRDKTSETLTDVTNPYVLPDCPDACDEWVFVGWYNNTYNSSSAPTFVTQATSNGDYYAVYRKTNSGGGSTTTDVLAYADLEADGTSYVDFEDVSKNTAVYAGKSAAGNSSIQLRSKDGSGIVSTTSGGVVSKVAVTWNTNTSSGRSLTIYGKNNAYTDAYDLYDSDTYGEVLGTIAYGSSTELSISGSYSYIGIKSTKDALYLDAVRVTWSTGSTYTYNTTTDCVTCSDAGASFSLGDRVNKNTESADFTNAVVYTNTNSSPKAYTSTNTSVATVNATSGLVHIEGAGTTTITLIQSVDMGGAGDEDNVCAVHISYELTVTPPTVDVVEVTSDDKIIIEHDIDGDTQVLLSEAETKIAGNTADDIFFSKYYEAASNLKLFGIYNGTTTYIDLSKLRVRAALGDDATASWPTKQGDLNYVEFSSIEKLGLDYPSYMLPPFTELIFWSNNYGGSNAELRACVSMTIDKVTYDMNDLEEGTVPNWYCLGSYTNYNGKDADGNNQMVFNGDDALILERNNNGTWEAIDIFGAGSSAAPIKTLGTGNGQIQKISDYYTIQGPYQKLNDNPGGWYWTTDAGATLANLLTTNRAYLVRDKEVKSGANAIARNTTEFVTLGGTYGEWHCTPVGGEGSYCKSGELFSEVGQYDFAHYYTTWVEVTGSGIGSTPVGDGTIAITIPNLADHSCNTIRIVVADASDPTDTLARYDYKVPIMIKSGTKTTTDALFTGFTDAAKVCSTCDVVIMDGATLKKVTGDVNALRDIEVYAGGKLYIPEEQTLTANQLIMRSKEDVIGTADIQGNLSRYNTTILHDKRIPGTRWYFFTLPYDCDLADITFRNGDPAVHGVDYVINYYDGEERAATATATYGSSEHWKDFTGTTLKAGQGYIIAIDRPKSGPSGDHIYGELRFPMKDPDMKKASTDVSVRAWGGDKTQEQLAANHKGWNLIGNTFLNTYQSGSLSDPLQLGTLELNDRGKYYFNTTGAKNIRFVYVPVTGGYGNYTTVPVSSQALTPFFSYFVQIGGDPSDNLSVNFAWSNVSKAAGIVRREKQEISNEPVMVVLDLYNSNMEKDETTVLISDQFTDDYDIMDDGVKWRGSYYTSYSTPLIATRNAKYELAFNALPDASAAAGIPINYYAHSTGSYTFALNGEFGIRNIKEALLYDATTGQYYDLLTDNHTFTLAAGDNTSRFMLFVTVDRKNVPTAIDNLSTGELNLMAIGRTLVLSGLYAAADIYVYDMSGKLICGDKTTGNGAVWRTTVPTTGVYFVRVDSINGKQTLRAIVK